MSPWLLIVSRIVSIRTGCGTLAAAPGCRAVNGPEPSRLSRSLKPEKIEHLRRVSQEPVSLAAPVGEHATELGELIEDERLSLDVAGRIVSLGRIANRQAGRRAPDLRYRRPDHPHQAGYQRIEPG